MAKDYLDLSIAEAPFETSAIDVHSVRGRQAISQLFEVTIVMVAKDEAAIDVDAAIGGTISLAISRADEEVRRIHGIIADITTSYRTEDDFTAYELTVVPRAWRLTLVQSQSIFMGKSVPAIIREKLELVGLREGDDFELRLIEDYPEREFVVQYRETDLAFVSRLAEHLGMYFFFEHGEGVDKIVFADSPERLVPISADPVVPFHRRGERKGVFELDTKRKMIPAFYACRDYNYRTALEMLATHELDSGDAGAIVEYGGHFKDPDAGERLARIRAEERQAQRRVHVGQSEEPMLEPGATFEIGDHPLVSGSLLLVSVDFEATQSVAQGLGAGDEQTYTNTFEAIDASVPYRPPRVTPRPRIHGVIQGYIASAAVGEHDKHADVDDLGRYTVRFMYDTAGPDERPLASRPVRQVVSAVGPNYGWHFPLRPGTEVMLSFVDGDPDRPLILGAVHNGVSPNPVVRNSQTKNRLRTESGVLFEIDDGTGS